VLTLAKLNFGLFETGEIGVPSNGIWAPISEWSCDISIDGEFYIEYEKIYI
jgi:hypothetical protein